MSQLRRLSILLSLALLPACQQAPSTPVLVPVVQTGTPLPAVGNQEAPDEAVKQISLLGARTADILSPALQKVATLIGGFYQAEARYRPSAYRVLSGVEGWEFRNGWYWRTDNDESQTLRAQLQDGKGVSMPWDVTLPDNYGPDMHPSFPANASHVRLEIDRKLSSGGRLGVSLLLILPPERSSHLEASGSGSATLPSPLGHAGFEALNASFSLTGPVERGDLVLKSLLNGATLQFSGEYAQNGLTAPAKIYRNAEQLGTVERRDGKWQFVNKGGSYPLE